jgi:hypothetical protein
MISASTVLFETIRLHLIGAQQGVGVAANSDTSLLPIQTHIRKVILLSSAVIFQKGFQHHLTLRVPLWLKTTFF